MFKIVIPARFAAQRLPGKPLADLGGQPLIQRVYERALEAGAEEVWVATDHEAVEQTVIRFGGRVCMTPSACSTGTDRIAAVAEQLDWPDESIVVNWQGDEPFLYPHLPQLAVQVLLKDAEAAMATLVTRFKMVEELFQNTLVKVVSDARDRALYFSRAPIPWDRDAFVEYPPSSPIDLSLYQKHLGLYAYRVGQLKAYKRAGSSVMERLESLEQLRFLRMGAIIALGRVDLDLPGGIDTPADLEKARRLLQSNSAPTAERVALVE